MSTTRLAQLFKEQTSRKIRSFDANSDVSITGFKDLPLDDADIKEVIEGLRYLSHQPRLEVDLSNTQLSETAIKSVAQWIESSDTPKEVILKLQNLTFSDEAIKALASAVISPKAPINLEVVLDGARLTEEGKFSLKETLLKIAQDKNGKNVKFSIAPNLFELHQGFVPSQNSESSQVEAKSARGRCSLI